VNVRVVEADISLYLTSNTSMPKQAKTVHPIGLRSKIELHQAREEDGNSNQSALSSTRNREPTWLEEVMNDSSFVEV
jgi:hypothetical protein